MADDRATAIMRHWDALEGQARRWHPIWRELATYLQPRKAAIGTDPQPGQPNTELLFDSVGVHANELLAASMQGSLTSMTVPFFGLRLRGLPLGMEPEVDRWAEACATTMYDELRQSSNFASESHEMYLDLGCFGIGAIFCEPRPPKPGQPYTGLRFTSFAPGTFAVDESADGLVDCLIYRCLMTARAAVDRWGMDAVSPAVRGAAAESARAGEPFPFLHAVYPRQSAIARGPMTPNTKLPWASIWVDTTGGVTVKTSGFHEFPFMVPRWTKASGEIYGRGPGFTGLPDLKTLNKIVELKLRSMAKVVNPPVKVRDDGVIGTVRLMPGGITHVRDMDAVQPMDLGGRFDVAKMEEDHLRQAIRRIFFTDQLQLQEGPQMTAYEVQVRYELMQRILGPTLGRLEVEWLNPLIERVFGILMRAGRLPEASPRVVEVLRSVGPIDVEYEGPLARAQRLSETVAMQRFFQLILPLAEAQPQVMDNLDLDEIVRIHATNTSVTPRILRLPYQRDEMRQARAQAQQAQSQQEQLAGIADVAGKGAPIIKALLEANAGGVPAAPVVPQV